MSFKITVIVSNKKLVTSTCYDKLHVSDHMHPFLR